MASIFRDRTEKDRAELEDKKHEISQFKDRLDALNSQIKASFTPDGAVTREGLQLEMIRLDIERRTKNPLDQGVQSLIQGQQNEIAYLQQSEGILLKQKATLLETINGIEAEMHTLVDRLERRSKNDA